MLEIVTQQLGFAMVSLALRNKVNAKSYLLSHPDLVSRHCLVLSNIWSNGTARDYLESLDIDLRNCLICNLVGDISSDVIEDYELRMFNIVGLH